MVRTYEGCFNISKRSYWFVSTMWPAVRGRAFAVPSAVTCWTPSLMIPFNSHTLGTNFNSLLLPLILPFVSSVTFNGHWFIAHFNVVFTWGVCNHLLQTAPLWTYLLWLFGAASMLVCPSFPVSNAKDSSA
jgi:hypothetical protein